MTETKPENPTTNLIEYKGPLESGRVFIVEHTNGSYGRKRNSEGLPLELLVQLDRPQIPPSTGDTEVRFVREKGTEMTYDPTGDHPHTQYFLTEPEPNPKYVHLITPLGVEIAPHLKYFAKGQS